MSKSSVTAVVVRLVGGGEWVHSEDVVIAEIRRLRAEGKNVGPIALTMPLLAP